MHEYSTGSVMYALCLRVMSISSNIGISLAFEHIVGPCLLRPAVSLSISVCSVRLMISSASLSLLGNPVQLSHRSENMVLHGTS